MIFKYPNLHNTGGIGIPEEIAETEQVIGCKLNYALSTKWTKVVENYFWKVKIVRISWTLELQIVK